MSTIGIDYGGRRIGVAVSESGVLASPHSVLANDGDSGRVIEAIACLGSELDAATYVVGLAKRARSHAGERKFHEFAERLRQRTGRNVVLWDETLSTVEAEARLREAGKNRKRAGREIDMAAAAVILQSYLDAEGGRAS
ncbi:MAG TPA: Holliday junction resolvase RuvX [Thermoanaerobaculia bacterium]|nr:Holliday junction resolvase RuvX [Thermoanaerobaculia bacterium]